MARLLGNITRISKLDYWTRVAGVTLRMHTVVNKLKEDNEATMTVIRYVSVLEGPLATVAADKDMFGFCYFAT